MNKPSEREQLMRLLVEKQDDVAMAGALSGVTERPDGTLDLGLEETVLLEGLDTNFNQAETALVRQFLGELRRQEQDHNVLMDTCEEVLAAYEASLKEIVDRGVAVRTRKNRRGQETPFPRWCAIGEYEDEEARKEAVAEAKEDENKASHVVSQNHHLLLPKGSVSVLKDWLYAHSANPYPTHVEKEMLAEETGLLIRQINNWMINARRRYLTNHTTKKRRKKRAPAPVKEEVPEDFDGDYEEYKRQKTKALRDKITFLPK